MTDKEEVIIKTVTVYKCPYCNSCFTEDTMSKAYECRDVCYSIIEAESLQDKIDTLYDEVFRPFFKHNASFVTDESNGEIAVEVNGHTVQVTRDLFDKIEGEVVESIWDKVHNHFNEDN